MKFAHVAFIALLSASTATTSHGFGEAPAQETPPTIEWFQGAHMSALGKARK